MALLLNIDTATEVASVCISQDAKVLTYAENPYQREHASFVHASIDRIALEAGVDLQDLEAFSVTSGPGSYTGLRVGMAAAKGFCYAFKKPLITVNTLEVMAQAALEAIDVKEDDLLCPMIDARRMEVFAAIYDRHLNNLLPPAPVVLEANSFANYISKRKIIFFGSGSLKFTELVKSENAEVRNVAYSARNLALLAEKVFGLKKFADTSYCEPNYFKDFQMTSKR